MVVDRKEITKVDNWMFLLVFFRLLERFGLTQTSKAATPTECPR